MASWTRRISAALLVGGLAIVFATDGTAADANPSTESIMNKVNGKKGLTAKISTAAKDEKWDDAQKWAKELKDLAGHLADNKAPKGTKESWEKLTKQYATDAGAIADAAEKKDGKALTTATSAFSDKEYCNACHSAHKPKKMR